MLNILQSNIETEEEGWIENLRQKETEVKKLRVELGELRNKYKSLDSLKVHNEHCILILNTNFSQFKYYIFHFSIFDINKN